MLLDEPFSGLDAASAERLEALLATPGRARAAALLIATHDVEQAARLGPRAVPQPPAGRVRPAGRGAHARGARGDLRRRDRRPARRRRPGARCPPTTTSTTTDGMSARLARPGATRGRRPILRRAFAEVVLLGVDRRRARLLGRPLPSSPTAPSRWPTRCCRASSSRRCSALPLLLGGAAGLLVAAAGDRAGRAHARGRPRHRGRRRRHRPVRRSACCWRCRADTPPGLQEPALRRRPRRLGRRPGCSPPALAVVTLAALRAPARSAAGRRLRPRSAPAALGVRAARGRRRAAGAARARAARRGPGAGQPARRRGARRPGGRRPAARRSGWRR